MKNKNKIINACLLLFSIITFAQVKIGDNPTAPIGTSSALELESTNLALQITRVANTAAIGTPVNGMLIYDISSSCVKGYENGAWTACAGYKVLALCTLTCGSATFSPATITAGTAYTGTITVPYTGGNGVAYPAGTAIASTGITGLSATLVAGTLASGAGNLTYNVTGTPSGTVAGNATFAITLGGQSCNVVAAVVPPFTIPATIILAQNRLYMLASVYDQDYLPYTVPTGAATTATAVAANGSNEAVTLNIQGTITTGGIAIKIPVTATGSNTLPAFSQTINIPAGMTEDGIARYITLSWTAQAYTAATTSINATIAAVGGTLNAKKLDVNAGIGNDALGLLIGQFTYPYNNAGATTTYSVRDIAGIPDRNIANANHIMLYIPVQGADGNVWLNNNLGADYSNTAKAAFNPAQQATSATDHLAYGSLFQWGRKADGHELITYTDSTTATAVNGTTSTNSNSPANALFILEPNSPYDWRVTPDDTLWATQASANNPCPVGFKVPTDAQLTTLVTASSITSSVTAASSAMKFTVPGYRFVDGITFVNVGINGNYWSSSVSGIYASYRYFSTGSTGISSCGRIIGNSVRCIKD